MTRLSRMHSRINEEVIKEGKWNFIKVSTLGKRWYIASDCKSRRVLASRDQQGKMRAVFLQEEIDEVGKASRRASIPELYEWLGDMIEVKQIFPDAIIDSVKYKR